MAPTAKRKGEKMSEKTEKLPRGVFRKDGVYWIRYAAGGKMRRQKVGPFLGVARAAYQKRKSEVREGLLFPKLRERVILFGEIVKDSLEKSHREGRRDVAHEES